MTNTSAPTNTTIPQLAPEAEISIAPTVKPSPAPVKTCPGTALEEPHVVVRHRSGPPVVITNANHFYINYGVLEIVDYTPAGPGRADRTTKRATFARDAWLNAVVHDGHPAQ